MKLNENGSKILRGILTENEGPYSKSENVMLALELMEKGTELASNQVTKVHLSNIIKALCSHLEWTEEIEESETVTTNETTIENEETTTSVNVQSQNSEKIKGQD